MSIEQHYNLAKEQYAALGVDTDKAIENLRKASLSIHCWQGDDVGGFETPDSELSGGGIQVTGNYPGRARTLDELRKDLETVYSMVPGNHRLNLHAIYGDFGDTIVDRDRIEEKHFSSWVDWARQNNVGLDFNATCFSHPKADTGFTLSSKDRGIRDFWIEHTKQARKIAAYFGKELGTPSVHNLWIPDGSKDIPVDRFGYRMHLKESLDTIFADEHAEKHMKDAVESKLFGIGSEAFVVGSHEFYLGYAIANDKMVCLDLGHFHPTESIADKISSVLQFSRELLLHVSRPVRWDSDHIVILNDDILALMQEIVRSNRIDDIHMGLDFFDATLNRIGAWAIGSRAALKGLLIAFLEPSQTLLQYESDNNLFSRLALLEQLKSMPHGAVWDYYCMSEGAVTDGELIGVVCDYEKKVTSKRV